MAALATNVGANANWKPAAWLRLHSALAAAAVAVAADDDGGGDGGAAGGVANQRNETNTRQSLETTSVASKRVPQLSRGSATRMMFEKNATRTVKVTGRRW